MYVSSKKAIEFYGVSKDTLRRWDASDKIKTIRTKGGHRRYIINKNTDKQDKRISYAYARVSSVKQKNDLQNQIEFLKQKYPSHTIVSDTGSGINFKRTGFRSILEQLFANNVKEVVVASSDRFSRFGFELFEFIFDQFNAKLKTINSETFKSPQEELSEDLMSIITVFSARYYGKRKYKTKTTSKTYDHQKTKNISK